MHDLSHLILGFPFALVRYNSGNPSPQLLITVYVPIQILSKQQKIDSLLTEIHSGSIQSRLLEKWS